MESGAFWGLGAPLPALSAAMDCQTLTGLPRGSLASTVAADGHAHTAAVPLPLPTRTGSLVCQRGHRGTRHLRLLPGRSALRQPPGRPDLLQPLSASPAMTITPHKSRLRAAAHAPARARAVARPMAAPWLYVHTSMISDVGRAKKDKLQGKPGQSER